MRDATWNGTNTVNLDDSNAACASGSSEVTLESVSIQLGTLATPPTLGAGGSYTVGSAVPANAVSVDVLFSYPDAGSDDYSATAGTVTFASSTNASVASGDFDVTFANLPDGGNPGELSGHFDAPYCAP